MPVLSLSGSIFSPAFHEAKLICDELQLHVEELLQTQNSSDESTPSSITGTQNTLTLIVTPVLESEWPDFLSAARKHYKLTAQPANDASASLEPLFLTHSTLGHIPSLSALLRLARRLYAFADPRADPDYARVMESELEHQVAIALQNYASKQSNRRREFAYFDIAFGDCESDSQQQSSQQQDAAVLTSPKVKLLNARPHRLLFELYNDTAPRTVERFLSLCNAAPGNDATQLSYSGTPIHRVVRGAFLQGGDCVNGTGAGASGGGASSNSTSQCKSLEDETYVNQHAGRGTLSLCLETHQTEHMQRHSAKTQFMLALRALPCFDGRLVVFGRLISGFDVLTRIERVQLYAERPIGTGVWIAQAGRVDLSHVVESKQPPAMSLDSQHTDSEWESRKRQKHAALQARGAKPTHIPVANKRITILTLGLASSGKSSIVQQWIQPAGNSAKSNVSPTNGFELNTLPNVSDYAVQLYGLGGADTIRGYWTHYFDATHAVVYVLDCEALQAAGGKVSEKERQALLEVRRHPLIAGKPLCLLLHKSDALKQPISVTDVSLQLGLEEPLKAADGTLIKGEQPMQILQTSTHSASGQGQIAQALQWCISSVNKSYEQLTQRVARDMQQAKQKAQQEMAALKERINAEKAAREANQSAAEEKTQQASARAIAASDAQAKQ